MNQITDLDSDSFLKTWEAWDRNPGNEYTATAMEKVCSELSKKLDCTTTNLRHLITEERRLGSSKEDIVDNLFTLVDSELCL